MDFCKRDAWLWVARKNFLELTSTHCVCLQASLWSYLSSEANGSIARRFNPILWFQTWADGDFSVFIPPPEEKVATFLWLPSKNGFLQTWCLTLSGAKKFSRAYQHSLCVFASFLMIISIVWSKREHRTTLQSDFMIPNVSWWRFFSFHTPSEELVAPNGILQFWKTQKILTHWTKKWKFHGVKVVEKHFNCYQRVQKFSEILLHT